MRIAFLGLGHMGMPMARNLLGLGQLGLGHTITVLAPAQGEAKALLALGAIEADSVAAAVRGADVAVSMISDEAALTAVVQGPSGLLENLPSKAIHLCMGTIGIETSMELASAHAHAGQGYVAAPAFGKEDSADARPIWIVVGGPESQVNRCRPIFDALGRGYTSVGPNAALAHALKLGGNMLSMAMELAVSELLTYARKVGLTAEDYLRSLNQAIFRSYMVDGYGGAGARPSFDPKDRTLDLAANELLMQKSRDMGVAISVKDLLHSRLQAVGARGQGNLDQPATFPACPLATEVEEPPAIPAPIGRATLPFLERGTGPTPGGELPLPGSASQPVPASGPEASPGPPARSGAAAGPDDPPPPAPFDRFLAMDGGDQVTLDLGQTSHFELVDTQVRAWSQGRSYLTPWRSLGEVELAFNHVLFLPIQRRILLRPEAVLDFHPTLGGGARARVGGDMALAVSRAAAPRLKELLGL